MLATESTPKAGIEIGTVVAGRYRVVRALGKGGMGTVWEVEHLSSRARYAMKTLLPGLHEVGSLAPRFEREAKAVGLLDHPHIVEVLDFGPLEAGGLYLVMELVPGRPLGDVIDTEPIAPRRALAIARQVLEALAQAHRAGVIHRDIKPDNVMIVRGEDGAERVKLLDFGIAKLVGDAAASIGGEKLTQAGIAFGTPDYMAPEQALGQEVDARADLYAVGLVLYEMLAGRRPFLHPDAMQVVRLQILAPPPTLAEASGGRFFPPALEALVGRALAKKRDERFGSAEEMLAAIDAAEASLFAPPRTPTPPAPIPPPWPAPPRPVLTPAGWLIAGIVLLFLILLVAVAATS